MGNWFSEPMKNEIPFSEIEKRSEEFHHWNFEPFTMQEIGYEGVIDKLKEYTAEKYDSLDDEGKEKMVKEVLDIYRSVDLLPIQYYSELGVMNEIEKCISYKAGFTGDTVSCVSGDTEYFNGENWVRIDSYADGDMVLQFNPDGTAELVDPIKYIHTKNNDKFYVIGEGDCSMVITGNHDVVFVDDNTNEISKMSVDEIRRVAKERTCGLAVKEIPVCCEMKDNRYSLDVQTNMIAWIINGILTDNESDCEYLQRLSDGTICFTDKIFRLNKFSRKQLLNMLGVDRCYSMDMFSEELAKQVVVLHNMTYFGNTKEATFPADHGMPYNAFYESLIGDDNMYERRTVATGRDEIVSKDDPEFIRSCCRIYDFTDGTYAVLKEDDKEYDFSFTDKYCFEVPSHMLVLRRNGYMFVTGNCGAGVGTTLCNYLFPNLFDVPSKHDLDKKDAETLFKKFHNDAYLSRAIKFCFSYKNGCPTPTNVMGGLRLVGSAPTNFRPMNAKAVYERFCPEGGTVYDFCCVDDETEFFNGKGWKSLKDYVKGDKVLQYTESGRGELVSPIEYIHYKSDDPFYLYNGKDLNTCLTGNHDVVYRMPDDSIRKVKMIDVVNGDKEGKVPTTFKYSYNKPDSIYCSGDFFDLLWDLVIHSDDVYVKGDAFLLNTYLSERLCIISKELNDKGFEDIEGHYLETPEMFGDSEDIYENTYNYAITCPLLRKYVEVVDGRIEDVSEELYNLSCKEALSLIKVSLRNDIFGDYSDGIVTLDTFCFNRYRDVIQFYVSGSEISCCCIDTEDDYKSYSKEEVELSELDIEVDTDDLTEGDGLLVCDLGKRDSDYKDTFFEVVNKQDKYCFVVPSHMLILRRKGKIFVTGNCGFGGRLLGCLSSKKNFRYVGTDPCTETMYHLHELGDYIEMVTGREDSYELHCCGSEDFRGPAESVDFAFSSPPYFDLEVYSDEETQCFNKFPELEDWLEGYVRATIKNIHHMLKRGAVYAVNIADFTVGGSKEVAYVDEWIRISTEEGMPLYDTVYLGVTARAGSAQQAAGELKKENILIFKKPL